MFKLALIVALLKISSICLSGSRACIVDVSAGNNICIENNANSKLPSTMISDEINLTKLTDEDVELLTQLILDGGIGEFFVIDAPTVYKSKQDIIDEVVLMIPYGDNCDKYVIRDPGTQKTVGEIYVSFEKMSSNNTVEIFYWVSANSRGHNYAYKASILLIDEILKAFSNIKIEFSVVNDNIASLKTVEKIKNYEKSFRLNSYKILEEKVTSSIIDRDVLLTIDKSLFDYCKENESFVFIKKKLNSCSVWSREDQLQKLLEVDNKKNYDYVAIQTSLLNEKFKEKGINSWIVKTLYMYF